jgi:hypothetical protein
MKHKLKNLLLLFFFVKCGFEDYEYDKNTGFLSTFAKQDENLEKLCCSFFKLFYDLIQQIYDSLKFQQTM